MEDSCKEVHTVLGVGFRESIYQTALASELRSRGYHVDTECVVPVKYKNAYVGNIRCDLIVNHDTIIESKAISKISEKERHQIRQYLRTTDLKKGYLVNFGTNLEVEYFFNE